MQDRGAYGRILAAIDGSPTAAIALRSAVRFAKATNAELLIASAHDSVTRHISETMDVLNAAAAPAIAEGVVTSTRVQGGRPQDVVIAIAERDDADLIVVGNKGMTHRLLGSVPARIAHAAPCDLLIVNTTGRAEAGSLPHRVLVATDGSGPAEQACRRAFELARLLSWEVVLAYCGFAETADIILRETVEALADGVGVRTLALQGDPAEAICRAAEEQDVDLIVVGTRGLSGMKRVLGSVSDKVAHHAPCDVLVVRAEVRDAADLAPGTGAVIAIDGHKRAVYRDDAGGLYVLSAKCTHMGCTVTWNGAARAWDCPCHGSRFAADGTVLVGPAVKPLRVESAPAAVAATKPRAPRRPRRQAFVIVGAGQAGATAAATLREEGFDGRIVLIGEEAVPPYERPPLSKQYLRGEQPLSDAFVQPAGFYESNEIEARLGERAERVDTTGRTVLVGGQPIRYDKLLLATGGRARHLPIPGIDLDGVLQLRTHRDADRIREAVGPGRKLVVVGMGFIGCEVAASLRIQGLDVVAIEGSDVPLERVVGRDIGEAIAGIHREYGVELVAGDAVVAFEGNGSVRRITTKQGRSIDCDLAVIGLGIEPALELVDGSGVEVNNGIVVDEHCRTNVPDVFAAGDVASHFHPLAGRHIRVEHWQHAQRHGEAAARNMLDADAPYDDVHWFWSDQYDYTLQCAGFPDEWDEVDVSGSIPGRDFVAYLQKAGRLVACITMGPHDEQIREAVEVIRSG